MVFRRFLLMIQNLKENNGIVYYKPPDLSILKGKQFYLDLYVSNKCINRCTLFSQGFLLKEIVKFSNELILNDRYSVKTTIIFVFPLMILVTNF